jgi:hypothetical protein
MGIAAEVRDFYLQPGTMTSLAGHKSAVDELPRDLESLIGVGQGLLIHEHLTSFYGITLSEDHRASVQIRPMQKLLDRVMDSRPLTTPRPAAERWGGNCRHFTVLLVAFLRSQGVPARARCGFGGYFGTGMYEDHWVVEYWSDTDQRWILADGQLDRTQQRIFHIGFSPLDVPRDQFLTAGAAWTHCRAGDATPDQFGMSVLHESGSWWIAQNLIRDVAALNNMEMLPWDTWGAMAYPPDEPIADQRREFYDRLARLTENPDDTFAELRSAYNEDALRVPPTVRNSALGRVEAVTS